ncbi:restriction endonuclease subunit S [Blautia stercoris]
MGKPKIRFKGYNDEWEQRKLGEVAQEFKSGNFLKADEIDIAGDYPVYGGNSLRGYTSTYNHDGEFALIGRQGALCGNMNYSVGKAYFTEHAVVVEADENNDTRFLYCMLDIMNLGQYSDQSAQPGLAVNKLIKLENFFPQKEEQQQIGWYFNTLDRLITLHQRKYDEMKTLKKYMLQKMFPQNGPKIPKIRFEGFTGEWEQRKFGEIVEKYEDPIETPTEGYTRLGIRSHAKGTFHSYVEKGKELETAKMFRVAADKFIVNITFGWEHAVAITDENDAGKLVSHRFPQYSFNTGMNPKFFRYLILDENFKHHLELSSPGGAGRNRVLKLSDMLQYKMNFPSEAEQKKIAAYFDDLDNLITLHQRKCNELKNIKKFMLQSMFV